MLPVSYPFNFLSFTIFTVLSMILTAGILHAETLTATERAEAARQSMPAIAEREQIRASLQAMQENGVLGGTQNGQAMLAAESSRYLVTVKHVLRCETEHDCLSAEDWAQNNGLPNTELFTTQGHGGEPMYHLAIRQSLTPTETAIHDATQTVHEVVTAINGTRYATWMIDLNNGL